MPKITSDEYEGYSLESHMDNEPPNGLKHHTNYDIPCGTRVVEIGSGFLRFSGKSIGYIWRGGKFIIWRSACAIWQTTVVKWMEGYEEKTGRETELVIREDY